MRRLCSIVGLLGAILGHAGCKHEALLRPPKNPEEYRIPPKDERYTGPPQPPKETLNQDPAKPKNDPSAPGGASRQGRMGQ